MLKNAWRAWCDRHWLIAECSIALVMLLMLMVKWDAWKAANRFCCTLLIFFIAIHVFEEWRIPGGFHYQYNLCRGSDSLDRYPLNEQSEMVVLLSKGEIDSKKVRVEFSLENMDMSGFQKGATYPQIKEYVQEHSRLKVSSLYISQVKRKCGLDVGQNYNLSKKENAKQPQCPPEKEKAIMEALRYYGMIK